MTTGIGIVTYRRPDRYQALADSIQTHLTGVFDEIATSCDGPSKGYGEMLGRHPDCDGINRGVAWGKNKCLLALLDAGCEWVFLAEDDMEIDSPEAVTGYLAAAEESGQRHLNFHAHGPANRSPMFTDGPITLWPNIVGSWSLYHRNDILDVGLMDVGMVNAFEHVHHTCKLMLSGACHRWPGVADATGSEYWLHEQPGAIEESVIDSPGRDEQRRAAIARWRAIDPETLDMIFPKGSPWHEPAAA